MLGVIAVSKEKVSNDKTPSVYDTEKIIDIHSSEWDPSLDSKKVRDVNSYVSRSKYTHGSNDINPVNKNSSDTTERIPSSVRYSDSDIYKDDDEFDYQGEY
jgi:hypothetical protein